MWRLLSGLLLVALLIAGLWLEERLQPAITPPMEVERLPDFTMEEAVLVVMDRQGRPDWRVTTPRLIHDPLRRQATLETPLLELLSREGPPWRITAGRGVVHDRADRIDLRGAVTLRREAAGGVRPMRIATRDVTVLPQRRLARSDAPTRIQSLRERLEGVGLEVDANRRRITLRHEVRGTHEP